MNIQIKFIFHDWQDATIEQARSFIKNLYKGLQGISGHEAKVEYIERNHLKGITFNELMEGVQ